MTVRARPVIAALLCCATGCATAQGNYPAKAVRILTAEVGGNNDWIARLNREMVRLLGTPDELAAIVKSEMDKWGRIIKAAGLRGE